MQWFKTGKSRDDQSESVQTQRFPILSCEKKIENNFWYLKLNCGVIKIGNCYSHTRKECLESMTPKILWECAVDLESCFLQNGFFKDGDQVCNPSLLSVCDRRGSSWQIVNLLLSVANLLLSTYTEIYTQQKFKWTTYIESSYNLIDSKQKFLHK